MIQKNYILASRQDVCNLDRFLAALYSTFAFGNSYRRDRTCLQYFGRPPGRYPLSAAAIEGRNTYPHPSAPTYLDFVEASYKSEISDWWPYPRPNSRTLGPCSHISHLIPPFTSRLCITQRTNSRRRKFVDQPSRATMRLRYNVSGNEDCGLRVDSLGQRQAMASTSGNRAISCLSTVSNQLSTELAATVTCRYSSLERDSSDGFCCL